jgi:hypothetical protein
VLFTGDDGEIVDGSVEDWSFTGVLEGPDYNQMRGGRDTHCIVPPVAVSNISGSAERGIRRIHRETAMLPRVD